MEFFLQIWKIFLKWVGRIKSQKKVFNENLKRPLLISSCYQAFKFCQSSMPSINFFYIFKDVCSVKAVILNHCAVALLCAMKL